MSFVHSQLVSISLWAHAYMLRSHPHYLLEYKKITPIHSGTRDKINSFLEEKNNKNPPCVTKAVLFSFKSPFPRIWPALLCHETGLVITEFLTQCSQTIHFGITRVINFIYTFWTKSMRGKKTGMKVLLNNQIIMSFSCLKFPQERPSVHVGSVGLS